MTWRIQSDKSTGTRTGTKNAQDWNEDGIKHNRDSQTTIWQRRWESGEYLNVVWWAAADDDWINWIVDQRWWVGTPTHTHTHINNEHETRRKHRIHEPWQYPPPPLGTPPGVPRLPYLSIVIIDKGVVQDVSSPYPTSLLWTVTFPVHQVLKSASPPSWVQNIIDRISGSPVYESRRGGERGGTGAGGLIRERKTGFILDAWKTGWILLYAGGRLRRTATGLMILVTVNGPMNLGASLLDTERRGMFLVESHTFWPATYTGGLDRWRSALTLVRDPTWSRVSRALVQVRWHLWTKAWAEGTATSDSRLGKIGGW